MNKGTERKLKWGLEDLSPLFRHPPPPIPPLVPSIPITFEVQFVTVCVPDHEGDAFLANAYLASQAVRQTSLFASLVSVLPDFNSSPSKSSDPFPSLELLDPKISRLRLSHQELEAFTQNGKFRDGGPTPLSTLHEDQVPFLIFLEFEPAQFHSLARVALLLDRVILFIQPQVESLREAYRLMKRFWSLNHEIEFLLLFRGRSVSLRQEEFLFERFSLIPSRFLGISPVWLGNLAFPEKNDSSRIAAGEGLGFNPESLLSAEGLRRPLSPEKLRFWNELQKILRAPLSHEARA